MERGGKDFSSEVHSPRLAAVTTKTCPARGSTAQRCQAGIHAAPSALLQVARIAGPVLGPGDMDESGAVCPQGAPRGARPARNDQPPCESQCQVASKEESGKAAGGGGICTGS